MSNLLALFLVAVSVALSNFAGSVAIGVTAPNWRTVVRVGGAFFLFEGAMPIIGLLLGHSLAGALGNAGHYIAGVLLVGVGAYTIWESWKTEEEDEETGSLSWNRLGVLGFALSVDNLAAGFALGVRDTPLVLSGAVMAGVSLALSLLGMELGRQIGTRAGAHAELVAGALLIVVGVALGFGLLR